MKLINSFECNKMFELHLYYNSIFYLFSVQPAGIPPIYLLALKTQIPFHCHYCSHFRITYLLSIKVEKKSAENFYALPYDVTCHRARAIHTMLHQNTQTYFSISLAHECQETGFGWVY